MSKDTVCTDGKCAIFAEDRNAVGFRTLHSGDCPTGANGFNAQENFCPDRNVREVPFTDEDWFAAAACALYGSLKAGTALHFDTGLDERSCRRYVAGEVKPPGYLVRKLLRSDHGWQWLCALMDHADPSWWRRVARAVRILDAIERL